MLSLAGAKWPEHSTERNASTLATELPATPETGGTDELAVDQALDAEVKGLRELLVASD